MKFIKVRNNHQSNRVEIIDLNKISKVYDSRGLMTGIRVLGCDDIIIVDTPIQEFETFIHKIANNEHLGIFEYQSRVTV